MTWDLYRDPQWQPVDVFEGIDDLKLTRDWPEEQHPDGISARLAVEFLEEERNQPLFLAVGLHRPHAPRAAPQKYFDQIEPAILPIPPPGKITPGLPGIAYPPNFHPDYAEGKIRATLHGYYASGMERVTSRPSVA